jgi:hypothetical protein
LRGEGILMIMVATQVSAASMAAKTSRFVAFFSFISITSQRDNIAFLFFLRYTESDDIEIVRKGENYITR